MPIELFKNDQLYRTLLDNLSEGVYFTDTHRRIQYWNKGAERITGFQAEDVMGRCCADKILMHTDLEDKSLCQGFCPLAATMKDAKPRTERVFLHHKEGHRVPVSTTTAPIMDDAGVVVGGLETFHDVTTEMSALAQVETLKSQSLLCPLRMLGTHTDITAMKQTEELLRLQSASLEAAANGIVITDVDGHVVWANPAFVRLTGYTLAESQGKNPSKLVRSGEHRTEFYETMWKTILAGNVWQGELINRRKDGTLYDEYMSITPVRDATGTITHFVAVKQDITERKQCIKTLQESESRFRGLIEDLDVGVILQDAEDRILLTNRAASELLGLPTNAVGNLSSKDTRWQLTREDGSPLPLDEVPSIVAARTGIPVRGAVIGSTNLATGTRVWLSVSASPRLDSHGDLNNVLVTAVNITAERQAKEAFVRSKEKLDRAVAAGHIALWEWDIVQNTCTYSDEWCHQVGCDRTELTGTPEDWWSRIHPEDLPRLSAVRNELDALANPALTQEYRILHKDGKYRWLLGSVSLVRDAAGKTTQMSGANIDITVRKELEAEFRQAQKMESIGRLAGGVAHNFNNILGVILGYTEMALDEIPEENSLYQDLTQVRNASLRAADLTNQLLAFSRRQVLRPELLDLNQVIKQSEKMLGRMVGEDIQILTQFEERLGHVLADPGQMNQVLLNLAVNARDAMPHGGSLTIQTGNLELRKPHGGSTPELPAGAYVCFSVTDTGTGMDRDTLSHLFEPFFTTKEQGKGTGLGLATVYGIVQQSGGTITVQSEIGRGTTFKIYLPRVDQVHDEAHAELQAAVAGGNETILLVEDEPAVRELTRRSLAALGYNVITAASAEEALQQVRENSDPIDLLLTDVIMPGISGAVLATRLHEQFPKLPVLFMSGYTDDAIAHHGVLDQGTHLINKPFRLADLALKIRERLETVSGVAND
jgi:PAS domain S-box-containing protein